MRKLIFKRIFISSVLGIVMAVLINEVSYSVLKTSQDRPPHVITLEIPDGTAARVAQGEADPTLPDNLNFVVGDTFVIRNLDSQAHQLGPFFIPADSSATLVLDTAQNFSYACSFRPDQVLKVNVSPAVTAITRMQGVLFSAFPMIILFSLYGLIALPMKAEEKTDMSLLGAIPRMFSRRWIVTTFFVLVAAAVCARLGIWQLDRLAGRRAFNSHILAMRDLPELNLNSSADEELSAQEYRRAFAEGTYDFANQFAIRNQYYNNELGYHLITPLLFADGRAVLVDRGWVPAEGNDTPSGWSRYDVPGPLRVAGLMRLGTGESTFGGLTDPTLSPHQSRIDYWNFINIERIATQIPYPLLPLYLQLDPSPGDNEPPIPFQPEIELSEGPHMGYAIQWFSFAAMLLLGYPFYLRKQSA